MFETFQFLSVPMPTDLKGEPFAVVLSDRSECFGATGPANTTGVSARSDARHNHFNHEIHRTKQLRVTRHYSEEVEMAFSGFDCVLNGEPAIYCSSELTTGLRLYKALREHHLETAFEFRKTMGQPWFEANIFRANVHSAREFAETVRAQLDDNTMIITPAPFEAPKWNQPEYLGFWETLIRTRIKSVWFNGIGSLATDAHLNLQLLWMLEFPPSIILAAFLVARTKSRVSNARSQS
jgi:hypothetical protein